MIARFTNIAAYRFAPLRDLKALRERLLVLCKEAGLKGTILLSSEGVNLFVAGESQSVERLLAELRGIEGLNDLTAKYSESDAQPFRRMLVRIKKEIISFGVEGIEPGKRTSPKLAPKELKQWLDEGRPVTLLDTRNDYEVALGTFRGAVAAEIRTFREFPDAVRRMPEELKEQPVVMFCTGGIRCEKAGPFMEREGFKTIYQLDGGILKYFEECGQAHYDGECFVFDQRTGVDPALAETETVTCFACQRPLTSAEQESPKYVAGKSCPHCWRAPEATAISRMEEHRAALKALSGSLPGCALYDNYRPLKVIAPWDGAALIDFLSGYLAHHPREQWERICEEGRMLDADKKPLAAMDVVRAGMKLINVVPATLEPPVNAAVELLCEDDALIVLSKPAPLPMHPGGRFNRNTLQHLMNTVWHPEKPHPAHRLDANTTGVVVFSRTRKIASLLQPQFTRGTVEKRYLARVRGVPGEREFRCDAPIAAAPEKMGTRRVKQDDDETGDAGRARDASTEFTLIREFPDNTSLIEARPLTGRTNQIRLHLQHLGLPVCGDRVYGGENEDECQTLPLGAPPLCLHAWQITFDHPVSGERVMFSAPPPDWAETGSAG